MDPGPIEHMGVNHCRRDIFVAKKLLNGADIVATFKQMRGKGMPKSVTTCRLPNAGCTNRQLD